MPNWPKVWLGNKEFQIPPLSLGQLRNGLLDKLKEHDKMLETNPDFSPLLLRGEIIIAALRRKYSEEDLPTSEIWDRLDLENVRQIWPIILGNSGFNTEPSEPSPLKPDPRPNGTYNQSTLPFMAPTGGDDKTLTNLP